MNCKRCNAPMQELFTSLVCSAECDLHESTQRIKRTLSSPDAISFLRAGKTLKCVACGCGLGCDEHIKLVPGDPGYTVIDDGGTTWPWTSTLIETALADVWHKSGHFWEVV